MAATSPQGLLERSGTQVPHHYLFEGRWVTGLPQPTDVQRRTGRARPSEARRSDLPPNKVEAWSNEQWILLAIGYATLPHWRPAIRGALSIERSDWVVRVR